MRKLLLLTAALILVGGAVAGYFIYNKPHSNMQKTVADLQIEAEELFSAFETDENGANAQFLDQVISVSGTIREVSTNEEGLTTIHLNSGSDMFGVVCELDTHSEHPQTDFQVGEKIRLKGLCTGMLMDVVLVRCVVE